MSLEQVLDETFQVWLDSFQGEISDDEEANKIWAGFSYALAIVREDDEEKAKKEYERAHNRYVIPLKKIQKLCGKRKSGYVTVQGKTYPCIGVFDPDEWNEPGELEVTKEMLEKERMDKYHNLSPKKRGIVDNVLSKVPYDRPIFWGCDYRIWFTYDEDCYGEEKGKYFTAEEGKTTQCKSPNMKLRTTIWKNGDWRLATLGECIHKIS